MKNIVDEASGFYVSKSTRKLAVIKYFYRIDMDDVVFDMLRYRFGESESSNVRGIIDRFLGMKLCNDVVIGKIPLVNDDRNLFSQVEEGLKLWKNNFLEDDFSRIESCVSRSIKLFDKMQGFDGFLPVPADVFQHVLMFFCFQIYRVEKCRKQAEKDVREMTLRRGLEVLKLTNDQRESVVKCMLYVFSYQLYEGLCAQGCSVTIFKNYTDVGFITSDNPAVFLEGCNDGVESGAGIIALSPKVLAKIEVGGECGVVKFRRIDAVEEAKIINETIKKNALKFVFSSNKEGFP